MIRMITGLLKLTLKVGVLAAGIGVIVAYTNLQDVDGWAKALQQSVKATTGRRLTINGDVDFQVSFPPRIVAHDVRLQNAKWGSKTDMLKVKTMIAEVDFMPLLFGEVAIPRLRMVGADILVEIGRDGKDNWDEFNEMETAAGGPTGTNFPSLAPVFKSGEISIAGGTLTVSNLAAGVVNAINLPAAALQVAADTGGSVLSAILPCN